MSDSFDEKTNRNSRKNINRLEEEIYDDIKTYKLKRHNNKNGRSSMDTFVDDINYDTDIKYYDFKKRNDSSKDKSNLKTVSENKGSKIRIKKQQSSGSDTLSFEKQEKNTEKISYFSRKKSTKEYSNKSVNKDRRRENRLSRNTERERKKIIVSDFDEEDYDDYYVQPSLKYRIFKRLITFLLVVIVVGGSASFIYVKSIISDMPVLTKKMVMESYINKEPVPLSKIPKNLQNAVISIEDQRFYDHNGIDYRSLIRSFVNNLSGSMTQGGSTIDMQVSKNLLTNNERTLKRKIQDMYNAIMLNKIMTKNEILEAYLNNIYLGKSTYGVQAGAKLYFGKNVNELNFGQSTMLAGITNNPSLYQNYEQAKKRQAIVLYKMYQLDYIKENVYKAQLYRDTPFKSEIDK